MTKDELRKFFEYRGVRISAIEICHYQLYDEHERVYALVEIRDIDQSKEFYTMFNNSTLTYYTSTSHNQFWSSINHQPINSIPGSQKNHVNIKLQLIVPNINEGSSLDEYHQILLATGYKRQEQIDQQANIEQRNTIFSSIILVGISSLLTELELFYLLSEKINENCTEEKQSPKPVKVVILDRNDVENNGIATVHYSSFNHALEAKKLLNQQHYPYLSKFFGPDFEGAILAEPPISQYLYKTMFYNESYILKFNKVPLMGA